MSAGVIHDKIQKMFPFLIADGWQYKGFGIRRGDNLDMVHLRFEKKIAGRDAFAKPFVVAQAFDDPHFDMKEWLLGELRKAEATMTNRALEHVAGSA